MGKALALAIRLKGVSKTEVARHFGVAAPSVHGWLRYGRISKEHIDGVVAYFADVVGPEHWGLPAEWSGLPAVPVVGLSADEGRLVRLWRELLLDEQREAVMAMLEREAQRSRKATAEVKRRGSPVRAVHTPPRELPILRAKLKSKRARR